MPTIVDVARRAEVSWNTVSRVINDDPSVRPATRRAVLQAIEELEYVPNAIARGLRNARTRTIGLVVSDLSDPVFSDIITAVEGVVRAHGYSLLICDSHFGAKEQAANLRTLYERRVEGLLIYPIAGPFTELELFVRAKIPTLLMDWSEPLLGLPRLVLNHRAGIQAATEYLLGLGHRRIGFVTANSLFGSWRAGEFRESLLETGHAYDPSLISLVGGRDEAAAAVRVMLARQDRPTALIGGFLVLLPPILESIQAAGLEIPHDISLISMGDAPWSTLLRPPLTALTTDRLGRGRMAAEYIFARLAGSDANGLLREWRQELVIRGSCAMAPIA